MRASARALMALEGKTWQTEPTLLGFDYLHVELVGIVPTTEI